MQAPHRGGSSDREKELQRRAESLEWQLERALAENERLRKQLEEGADLRFAPRRRGASRTRSLVDGGGAQQRMGTIARAHGAGAGTGLRVEGEPEWGMPGLGATGESGGADLPATAKRTAAKPGSVAGRHGLESGRTPQNLRVLLSEQVTVHGIEPHRG